MLFSSVGNWILGKTAWKSIHAFCYGPTTPEIIYQFFAFQKIFSQCSWAINGMSLLPYRQNTDILCKNSKVLSNPFLCISRCHVCAKSEPKKQTQRNQKFCCVFVKEWYINGLKAVVWEIQWHYKLGVSGALEGVLRQLVSIRELLEKVSGESVGRWAGKPFLWKTTKSWWVVLKVEQVSEQVQSW